MGARFLIDTNVLVGAQMKDLPESALRKLADIVLSRNVTDFNKIKGVSLENPWNW